MILHTGIALGATLVLLVVVVGILQYREKVCFVFVEITKKHFVCFRLKMITNETCKSKNFISKLYNLFSQTDIPCFICVYLNLQ
jgi:hypothetical protein